MVKAFYSNKFIYNLPEGHRFPIAKYDLIVQQLIYEATLQDSQFAEPSVYPENVYLSIHTANYWQQLKSLALTPKEIRKIGLPVNHISLGRAISSVAATIDAAVFALEFGCGINIGGGTHHAFRDRGEGFCILNDLTVAAEFVLNSFNITRILILDLDVHQGNGTAHTFQEIDKVFTFSMHCAANYPLVKEKSDLDVELEVATRDQDYLYQLQHHLEKVLGSFRPDFVFYQAGVDVLGSDRLGRLALSKSGCKLRDELVLKTLHHNNIPVCITMGGGYSPVIGDIVEAHCNTIRTAVKYYEFD